MYSKIAFSNVKKSIRDYTIYFLTLTFGICLFYMFNSVQAQQAVLKLNASQKSMMHLMSVIINGISVFVAIILGFLIVYANQFLMKRRHKEMGIYLLLGMEKRQVSKILLIETLLIGVLALIAGLVSGVHVYYQLVPEQQCFGIDRRIGFRCVFITRTCDVDSKDVCGSDERVSVCFLTNGIYSDYFVFCNYFYHCDDI